MSMNQTEKGNEIKKERKSLIIEGKQIRGGIQKYKVEAEKTGTDILKERS